MSWTHFLAIIYLDDPLQREFYAEMCRVERWSTRTSCRNASTVMLFERTALSKKPAEARSSRSSPPCATRTGSRPTSSSAIPYVLDFLGLRDTYSEKDLETALLREIERFLLELGAGFAFVERQKRITLDGDDYFTELPAREVLEQRFHEAVVRTRLRCEQEAAGRVAAGASAARARGGAR